MLSHMEDDGRLQWTEEERDVLLDAVCVEYEELALDISHHENLYRHLSAEADRAIQEIDQEEERRYGDSDISVWQEWD